VVDVQVVHLVTVKMADVGKVLVAQGEEDVTGGEVVGEKLASGLNTKNVKKHLH
tara:strand:- start:543 stop:704 length:162 start_codon:yes stop_codon:yes gene_type:complete